MIQLSPCYSSIGDFIFNICNTGFLNIAYVIHVQYQERKVCYMCYNLLNLNLSHFIVHVTQFCRLSMRRFNVYVTYQIILRRYY